MAAGVGAGCDRLTGLQGEVWLNRATVEGDQRRVRVGVTVEFDWIAPAGGQDG